MKPQSLSLQLTDSTGTVLAVWPVDYTVIPSLQPGDSVHFTLRVELSADQVLPRFWEHEH